MSKAPAKKSVVVVGGGSGGILVALQLSAKLDHTTHELTLVDARPHNIWLIAGARMAVSGDKEFPKTAVFPYDRVLPAGKGTVKHGRVIEIQENKDGAGGSVLFQNGDKLAYDVLVLSTGARWSGPLDFPDGKPEFTTFVDEWRDNFKAANDITLIGGGSVGIELAGELRDEYPEKKITLVHGQSQLLNEAYLDKFRKYLTKQVQDRNIDLVLEEYVDSFPEAGPGELVLKSGKKLSSDFVVRTTGPKPNTEFIASSLGDSALSAEKYVKVSPKLQLADHPSIFALGDIIDWAEQKQAAKTNGHASVVVANVLSYLAGKPVVKEYKGSPEIIIVTNGKASGAAYLPFLWGIILGPWFARLVKSKTLLISMIKSRMGY